MQDSPPATASGTDPTPAGCLYAHYAVAGRLRAIMSAVIAADCSDERSGPHGALIKSMHQPSRAVNNGRALEEVVPPMPCAVV